MKGRTKIKSMSMSYIDYEFKPNSHIWTGKGGRKEPGHPKENKNYIEEFNFYNQVFKKVIMA